MKKKIAIRKKILLIRKKKYFNIPSNFFNPLIKILKKKKKNKIKILSLYYPSNFEVNTLNIFQLIKKINIKTLLPVVKNNNEMNFMEWRYLDPLNVNSFGMLEPSIKTKPQIPDLMLVPLLAFDRQNNRIGYGKGFYDKFLNKFLKKKIF